MKSGPSVPDALRKRPLGLQEGGLQNAEPAFVGVFGDNLDKRRAGRIPSVPAEVDHIHVKRIFQNPIYYISIQLIRGQHCLEYLSQLDQRDVNGVGTGF